MNFILIIGILLNCPLMAGQSDRGLMAANLTAQSSQAGYGIERLNIDGVSSLNIQGNQNSITLRDKGYTFTQTQNFVFDPYNPCGKRGGESVTMESRARFVVQNEIPMITAVAVRLTAEGQRLLTND